MITMINRMELFTCDNQEAAAEIWSILEANNIEYKMVTNQDTSSLQKNIRYHQIQKTSMGGIPASYYNDTPQYTYTIYVRGQDLEKAKELCSI